MVIAPSMAAMDEQRAHPLQGPPGHSPRNGEDLGGSNSATLSAGEVVLDSLLTESKLARAQDLPALVARHAAALGARDAMMYLSDIQQTVLVPFLPVEAPAPPER